MADMKKKMAAALAAVNAYLEVEETQAAARSVTPETKPPPPAQQSYWSQSGRQDMMTMRRLIQMRTFAGYR